MPAKKKHTVKSGASKEVSDEQLKSLVWSSAENGRAVVKQLLKGSKSVIKKTIYSLVSRISESNDEASVQASFALDGMVMEVLAGGDDQIETNVPSQRENVADGLAQSLDVADNDTARCVVLQYLQMFKKFPPTPQIAALLEKEPTRTYAINVLREKCKGEDVNRVTREVAEIFEKKIDEAQDVNEQLIYTLAYLDFLTTRKTIFRATADYYMDEILEDFPHLNDMPDLQSKMIFLSLFARLHSKPFLMTLSNCLTDDNKLIRGQAARAFYQYMETTRNKNECQAFILNNRWFNDEDEPSCGCGSDCTCGCQEGKECTCEGECHCDDDECSCDDEKCSCGSDCTCGCQEGKECTCEGECHCDDDECSCDDEKCSCGSDCTCGCQEGKECTCEDDDCDCGSDCTCGCQEGKECTCEDDDCDCGCEDDCDCDDDDWEDDEDWDDELQMLKYGKDISNSLNAYLAARFFFDGEPKEPAMNFLADYCNEGGYTIAMLFNCFFDGDKVMRMGAAERLATGFKFNYVTENLVKALEYCKDEVKCDLLVLLGRRGDLLARPAILAALHDKDEAVRAAAMKAAKLLPGTAQFAEKIAEITK